MRIIYTMKKVQWTHEERQLLKDNYGHESMSRLIELLPGRTENSIYKQVQYLRKRGWTFNERSISKNY